MKMGTNARAIRTHETIHPDWGTAKAWVKAMITKERMVNVVLCAATVTVVGVILFSLHKAMGNSAIVGTFTF
jgi:hypothetical protein